MMNLIHHHRVHVPNGIAMLAAVLLLASSVYGYQASVSHEATGEQVVATAPEAGVSSASEDLGQAKRRGLNLGLLLFRR